MKKLLFLLLVISFFSCADSPVEPTIPESNIICLTKDITIKPLEFKIITNSNISKIFLNDTILEFIENNGTYYFSTSEMYIQLKIVYENNLYTKHFLYYRY